MQDYVSRLIIALDYHNLDDALAMARRVAARVGMVKVGLELFNSAGPKAIGALADLGARVFYDAKLYDIPNTVAGAAAAIGRMGVTMVNVHALGGKAMMHAAKEGATRGAAEAGLPAPKVIGVTIVTSLGDEELRRELGLQGSAREAVVRLAHLAQEAGLDGVVASVQEVAEVKLACGSTFLTVTPGIRPAFSQAGNLRHWGEDQTRTATPRDAVLAGSDYLVIGRPVTRAEDPGKAITAILQEMGGDRDT
jgi:orotidine-5'-phosphate decarboxylase